ncbi:hypothetical protein Clacol_005129 [Clathrus columnatus]|uniref:NAD-dependent epimerase/dehydratase domain-containing protein n=1 Tax=Clathrus columnatus TaxID=1419009 RepID=A0AAV5AD21_9AGAM|nr:hypothetical protein Clacol_005129 [Clathrus columnatus]
MPSVPPGSKVLVTGASGFIAIWIVKYLLQNGFSVRGTVRSIEKGKHLQELFKEYRSQFEYIVVGDMAVDGAFDEAVKGVDVIEHTASPFHFHAEDPDDIIKPAIQGTTNILESALNYGLVHNVLKRSFKTNIHKKSTSLKRVVVLASTACIIEPILEGQKVFSEKDWNRFSLKEIEEKGRGATAAHKYRASKTLAEKAAWNFMKINADKISWDLVTIQPPFVWGPPLQAISSLNSLNTSLVDFYNTITGKMEASPAHIGNWVDVRDVAEAHVKVLTTEEAGGERFIICACEVLRHHLAPFSWQDVLDAVHSGPSEEIFSTVPRGVPGSGKTHFIMF